MACENLGSRREGAKGNGEHHSSLVNQPALRLVERRRAIFQTGAALATLLAPAEQVLSLVCGGSMLSLDDGVEQAAADAVAKSQRKKQRAGQQEKKPRLEAEREVSAAVHEERTCEMTRAASIRISATQQRGVWYSA